jgi:hypothetical protein
VKLCRSQQAESNGEGLIFLSLYHVHSCLT